MDTTLLDSYRDAGDLASRDELLSQNLRLVHHVARQVARSSRADIEFEDLVSAGTIGLINAIDNFDTTRGLAFSTFAAPRIRGAILDDLRRRDHVPRSVRRKQRELGRAKETLQARLGRAPSEEEIAEEMGIEIEKLWRWQRDAEHAARISLDHPTDTSTGTGATPEELISGEAGHDIEDVLNREQEVTLLRDEILKLKEQERIVLSLYYFEELKLHEIASIMSLTESRISQIRSKAISNLRSRLTPEEEAACA
jgi:RNA polymerase sigma factor for flagellar operon FliA